MYLQNRRLPGDETYKVVLEPFGLDHYHVGLSLPFMSGNAMEKIECQPVLMLCCLPCQ